MSCELSFTRLSQPRCTVDLCFSLLMSWPSCCCNWKNISRHSSLLHNVPPSSLLTFLLFSLKLQACAPLYSWRTEKDVPLSDATGTCYLSTQNFTKFVEYAPCRTGSCHPSFVIKCLIWFITSHSVHLYKHADRTLNYNIKESSVVCVAEIDQ